MEVTQKHSSEMQHSGGVRLKTERAEVQSYLTSVPSKHMGEKRQQSR